MSIQDEVILMRRLEQILQHKNDVPAHIRRYYRKLCIRQENRHLNRKVFDLEEILHIKKQKDCTGHNFHPHYKKIPPGPNNRILDRFQVIRKCNHSFNLCVHLNAAMDKLSFTGCQRVSVLS